MKKAFLILLMLILQISNVCAKDGVFPVKVEVFTNTKYEIRDLAYISRMKAKPELIVYKLDGLSDFEKELSKGLSKDKKTAYKQIKRKFDSLGKEQLEERAIRSYMSVVMAYKYGLTHYPAIVFNNGESVMYGVTDMGVAMRKYWEWTKRK